MKKSIFFLLFYLSLQANDIERINLLVTEVKHLQSNYTTCQKKLFSLEDKLKNNATQSIEACTKELSKEHEKFINLQKLLEQKQENKSLENALVHNLQKKMQRNETLLLQKQKQIKALKLELQHTKEKLAFLKEQNQKLLARKKKVSPNKKVFTCKKDTQVIIKKEEVQRLALTSDNHIAIQKQTRLISSKAKTYRTKKKADIYNAPNGSKISTWEKGRSFTSYISEDKWIKITGFFIDKKWTKAEEEMWIKKEDAFER